MKKATVLQVTCPTEEVWHMLGDLAFCYGDNGGDPDGNCWLPDEPVAGEPIQRVIGAKLGRMVEVNYLTTGEMMNWASLSELETDEEDAEQRTEFLEKIADERTPGWAYFTAKDLWVLRV